MGHDEIWMGSRYYRDDSTLREFTMRIAAKDADDLKFKLDSIYEWTLFDSNGDPREGVGIEHDPVAFNGENTRVRVWAMSDSVDLTIDYDMYQEMSEWEEV